MGGERGKCIREMINDDDLFGEQWLGEICELKEWKLHRKHVRGEVMKRGKDGDIQGETKHKLISSILLFDSDFGKILG
jgi:hypothetical protein